MTLSAKATLLVLAMIFCSCGSCSSPMMAPPPPPPPPHVGAEPPNARHIPVRDFLLRGDHPATGLGAYGYLLFPSRSSPETRHRYLRVCESYFRNLEAAGEYVHVEPRDLMVTYWLLTKPIEDASQSKCDLLIDTYDYASAKAITSAVGMLSASGPVLAAWRAPYTEAASQTDSLVLDMSQFSDGDLDRAFTIWNDRIARDPVTWQGGFQTVKVREAFRNFVETYGEGIIKIAAPKILEQTTPQRM